MKFHKFSVTVLLQISPIFLRQNLNHMKKTLYSFLIIVLINFNAFAQTQTISLQPSYTNQSFYSLENGEISNVDNTNWDLAFSTASMSSSIRINGGMGTELYSYPLGDTTDWYAFNYSNHLNWSPVHNSDTNWYLGAFDKHSTSAFDMGWGMYSMITHYVYGDSLYAIKTVNGNWKKLWIEQLASGEYTFRYANFDGSNEISASVQKSNFSGKNFAYYSIDQNTSINREPNSSDWDITFTKYISPVQGLAYGVTGVLSNYGIEVAQADNVPDPNTYTDYTQHTMMTEMNAIGYDWKTFSMSTFSYSIEPNRCYFVKDYNDKIWRIVFNSFEGSSTGNIEFNTQDLTSSSFISDSKSDISAFEIYPNPISDNNLNIVFDNTELNTELNIYDITGKNVYSDLFYGNGFQSRLITLPDLKNGIYIVAISSKGSVFQKKLVIR